MDFHSKTAFPIQGFASLDRDGILHRVCVLKARCPLVPNAKWTPVGAETLMADAYRGDPARTSMRQAGDLAPFKPRADIYFKDPVAVAPQGRVAESWGLSVEIGKLKLSLAVCGPRQWSKSGWSWRLSRSTPVTEVTLGYELAYGGTSAHGVFERNPIGRGFAPTPLAQMGT